MKSPNLSPSCPGWQEDLPGPDELPLIAPALGFATPNHQDDIFLELPRASAFIRGLVIWFVPLMSVLFFVLSWLVITIEHAINLEAWAIVGSATLVIVWSILFCIKFDLSAPRDLPLRFNRSRNRIYAYNFNYRWWNPFERWRVEPVAYDWSQVRAERWLKRGATGNGVVIKGGVVLSIVKPGTNEVIDRFPLTTMGADAHAWAYICTYMQQGPDALPPPGPAKDHNDVGMNIALLLAPKVEWPVDMDLESRTAP